ncbi:MAG TPA: aminotransferase class V-fold PLP-dependent enzyme [Acidimicrobiia bacterium]|nr:aminotransferase class V-fold PLP-dependent enzyme [Acidimicrobiia bacterium]
MSEFSSLSDRFRPQGVYLDTATYGLPSLRVMAAMTRALERWQAGVATMDEYDEAVAASRDLMATVLGSPTDRVAVANQVSVFSGLIASSLPDGTRVVVPEGEFTSLLFPFLVGKDRGIRVREVPAPELAGSINAEDDLVAFSLVQSSDGSVLDSDAIVRAARAADARIVVDATQAAGWYPFDPSLFDYTVISAYKWLLCPRGTAFLVLGADAAPLTPAFAGWYAGDEVWKSIYGSPLRLAPSARRYDVSPAWFSWVGAVPSLDLIASLGLEAIHRHDVGLAQLARERLGLTPSGSAMLSIPLDDPSVLRAHGIAASVRAGSVRVGFHLYNDEGDVERLVTAVESARRG